MEEFSTSILNFSALQPQQRIRAAASRTQLAIVLLYPHSVRATAQRYGISRYLDTTNGAATCFADRTCLPEPPTAVTWPHEGANMDMSVNTAISATGCP